MPFPLWSNTSNTPTSTTPGPGSYQPHHGFHPYVGCIFHARSYARTHSSSAHGRILKGRVPRFGCRNPEPLSGCARLHAWNVLQLDSHGTHDSPWMRRPSLSSLASQGPVSGPRNPSRIPPEPTFRVSPCLASSPPPRRGPKKPTSRPRTRRG